MSPEELLTELRDIIANYERDVQYKLDELTDINAKIADAQLEKNASSEDLKTHIEANKAEKARLEEEMKPIRKELQRLKGELESLTARKAELMTANAQLEKRNRDLVAYEKSAWIVLRAKDDELKAKERDITEKASLRPGVDSFLPPISD